MSETGELPVELEVVHPGSKGRPEIVQRLPLIEKGDSSARYLWLQHSEGRSFDVAALPIAVSDGADSVLVDMGNSLRINGEAFVAKVAVAQRVFVVGYPFGLNGGSPALGVWTSATIATEPDIDLHGVPRLMIDGATREGLSGAPVYAHWDEGSPVSAAARGVANEGALLGKPMSVFIGIYSGRYSEQSDLGYVWKPSVIRQVLTEGESVSTEYDLEAG